MDWDGKVDAAKLVCAVTGEAIPPGTFFHSALTVADGRFVRLDFAPHAWAEQDQGRFLSWWRHRAPAADDARPPIDVAALQRMFQDLKGASDRHHQCFAYVLALFLVRARKLRLLDIVVDPASGGSVLLVEDRERRCVYRLHDPAMTADEQRALQADLLEIVGAGRAPAGT